MFERLKVKQQTQFDAPEHTAMYQKSNEVDLRDIFTTLWEGKLLIVATTFLFVVSSIVFALLAQEWWSSSAKITTSQPQNLANYQQQVTKFQPIFNVEQDDGTVLVSHELNALFDTNVLFKRFINTFNSSNNKRSFLNDNSEFQSILATDLGNGSKKSMRLLYSKWFARIKASMADPRGGGTHYFVSFQTTKKESSFSLLTAYISFTEDKVRKDAFNNLQAIVSSKQNELIQQKKILESQARNQLLVETERTKYAMQIAKAAGVEKPIQTNDDNELFNIDLGFNGLQAKLKALSTIENLSVIEPRLQQIDAKLDMLGNIEVDRNVEFQTFRFLENVEQPITRDKPKRFLIVLVGALLGSILSVVIVLFRFAFSKED
ncbi:LPS O-antigen chain length determinant protein WzzB [Vibrio lentus]|uniref:LPS O-antigen chain length determinant protein WzzB n=1 Tax=Vibrio lentus TaxID=136468 RepID=UPI000CAD63C9|nr:chain-length determining protein [Vibrio lentus]PMH91308.1 chain-length determining protein [Vibrio lentus]PMJ03583.1 chain-length determining protein [Vibrio lentus]PMJ21259.1 chain-length determining protein [Vibrio lentus]